ncbi:UNKNOWN [Stylonychia lemnae]|uniref:Uncharacterized protein n=1 Tax=Stylonychia lemnae TaxID=5949 RepID=A0A078BBU2_STYLE|nr:UNKNOWN [Stylonychia lemnae]|eukprot:CDW91058.1 UNKNOWN [Stylonychia lemnae]
MAKVADKKKYTIADCIKSFDFYRVMPRELSEATVSGATISVISSTLLSLLLVYEFAKYMQFNESRELAIANPMNSIDNMVTIFRVIRIQISLYVDIDFHGTPCDLISMTRGDSIGSEYKDVFKHTDKENNFINKYLLNIRDEALELHEEKGSIDVNDIIEKRRQRLGCRIQGHFRVYKQEGHFTITTGGHNHQLTEALNANGFRIDFSHKIRSLFFHDESDAKKLQEIAASYEHQSLKGTIAMQPTMYGNMEVAFYSAYYLDVTQNIQRKDGEFQAMDYQYTSTHQNMIILGSNSFNVKYDMSPISVIKNRDSKTFYSFIVGLCTVIGGFITVTSIIDSIMRNLIPKEELKKK